MRQIINQNRQSENNKKREPVAYSRLSFCTGIPTRKTKKKEEDLSQFRIWMSFRV